MCAVHVYVCIAECYTIYHTIQYTFTFTLYNIQYTIYMGANALFSFISLCLQCEPGLGASVMYNLLYNKPQKLMLLAGCSTVCTTVAEAAKMWNLIVVSSGFLCYFVCVCVPTKNSTFFDMRECHVYFFPFSTVCHLIYYKCEQQSQRRLLYASTAVMQNVL